MQSDEVYKYVYDLVLSKAQSALIVISDIH